MYACSWYLMSACRLHFLGSRWRGCSGGRHRNTAAAAAAAAPVDIAGALEFVGKCTGAIQSIPVKKQGREIGRRAEQGHAEHQKAN